jgi:alcohol dehydrogenase
MDLRYAWTYEQTVIGSNGWSMDDLQALVAMAEAGRLAPHIDRVLPLEESAEAERMLEERRVFGKIILKP